MFNTANDSTCNHVLPLVKMVDKRLSIMIDTGHGPLFSIYTCNIILFFEIIFNNGYKYKTQNKENIL